jgi:hypothetical protein
MNDLFASERRIGFEDVTDMKCSRAIALVVLMHLADIADEGNLAALDHFSQRWVQCGRTAEAHVPAGKGKHHRQTEERPCRQMPALTHGAVLFLHLLKIFLHRFLQTIRRSLPGFRITGIQ